VQTRHYLQQIVRLLALVLLPILALVTGTAEPLVTFIFSAAYQPAAPILTVLIFAYAAYTVYITLVMALLAENRPGRALVIPAALLPVAVGVVWLGVTWFGVMGAAFATLLSIACAAGIAVVYVLRRHRPVIDFRSLGRIAVASIVVWGCARGWTAFASARSVPAVWMLAAGYGVCAGLYLTLLIVLRELGIKDLARVKTWLPSRRRGKGV
jgi:PST family polysaccharide transporter